MPRLLSLFVAFALVPSLAGAAAPSADDVRRWLDELLFLHAPGGDADMALEATGDPQATATAGSVAAVLPGATLWLGDAGVDLGDLAIEVTPGDGPRFDVAILVPQQLPVTDRTGAPLATLTLQDPSLSGTWDDDLDMFVDVVAGAATVQLFGGVGGLRSGAVEARHVIEPAGDGAWRVTDAAAVAGLALIDSHGSELTIESVAFESTVDALDLASYRALVETTGVDPLSFSALADLEPRHLRVLADFYERVPPGATHERLRATGVSLRLNGTPLRTDSLDVATDTDAVRNGTLTLTQRSQLDGVGLDIDGAEGLLAPRDADITLAVEHLPLVALARALERHAMTDPATRQGKTAMAMLMAELPRILEDAGTEVRIVDSRFRGPLLTATFDGYARPDAAAPRGATGLFTVELAGFARAQEQLGQLAPSAEALRFAAALAVLELIGEPVDDRPGARHCRLEAIEDGTITLNCAPIGELLALLMPETQP